MAKQVWYVTSGTRTKVDLATVLTNGAANTRIDRLVIEDGAETTSLWATVGQSVSTTKMQRAVAEQQAGSVPAPGSSTDPTAPDYDPLVDKVKTVATSGATQTIPDVTTAELTYITLTANCALTFPAAAAGKKLALVLKQDGTGSRTITWPASVKWAGGAAPTLSTAANAVDSFNFLCADGTTWQGFTRGKDMR